MALVGRGVWQWL